MEYAIRQRKTCPICLKAFNPKGGKQRCCSKGCARLHDWQTRQPKATARASGGYTWRYVENHPNAIRLHKNMRPHGGYILEHRLIMEQILGRYLGQGEYVHHKNGIRSDNRPENLELWIGKKDPVGQRVEDLLESLKEQPELCMFDNAECSAIITAIRRVFKL